VSRRRIKIPKSFELGGKNISVVIMDELLDKRQILGEARYNDDEILVQNKCKNPRVTAESMEQTFLHELVHWFMLVMGEDELRKNEKFVDLLAVFLHQYLKSAEY